MKAASQAPPGFSFSPNPCRVNDLEDYYYATPGQMGMPTHRLPGLGVGNRPLRPINSLLILRPIGGQESCPASIGTTLTTMRPSNSRVPYCSDLRHGEN